ncbi:MAG: hypothetical protein EVA89_27825 [Sandaracinaceae bacterium]|nr:MAG: hypothetical protein EVA89_27825 [Sandaracinaceae bacterium]
MFDQATHERLCEETFRARDAAWAACGAVDPHVLAPMINPAFTGAPAWPNLRQAYKTIRGPDGIVLATDGLSDPFDDSWRDPPSQNGFAMEVFGVTDVELPLTESWIFQIVAGFATQVAGHGHIHSLLDELGCISTELYDVPIPDEARPRFVNAEGRVGVLVGLVAPPVPESVQGPLSSIRLASLKLLTLPELKHIVEGGETARDELAERLRKTPHPLRSSLSRESVY